MKQNNIVFIFIFKYLYKVFIIILLYSFFDHTLYFGSLIEKSFSFVKPIAVNELNARKTIEGGWINPPLYTACYLNLEPCAF